MTIDNSTIWNPNFHKSSKIFSTIIPAFKELNYTDNNWPTIQHYQNFISDLGYPIINKNGKNISFVTQNSSHDNMIINYESEIYLTGNVPTRLNSWHDFFQVLVWRTFPKSKSTLNHLHYQASCNRSTSHNRNRSPIENHITLFDECGAILVSSNPSLLELIKNFRWKTLFLENRPAFEKEISAYVFGHAMLEKAINPYIGMTTNSILVEVENDFFRLDYSAQLSTIDELITEYFDSIKDNKPEKFHPIPILGIPSWFDKNENPEFYNNLTYFRPGRKK